MKPILNKGDVLQINIEGNMTNCIVINIKTHKEFRSELTGGQACRQYWLEYLNDPQNTLTIINYHITYIRDYDESICYELMIGDDKVWLTEVVRSYFL